jgi:exodeoxyribonuclease V alpha subunit
MKKLQYTQGDLFGDMPVEEIQLVVPQENHALDNLFQRLAQSKFRSSFKLTKKDLEYIRKEGLDKIRLHATDFVRKRLAPADIPNDGKQTPYHGHPVFKAQHATGCCCRGCFEKWHHISKGIMLTEQQQEYAVDVLMEWIIRNLK